MYQVITMYGDNEPWWFFEEWQADIQETTSFDSLDKAVDYYENRWNELRNTNTYSNAKQNFLSAFWKEQDERWCEECDDYLQQYWGLALLKDEQPLTVDSRKEFYETANYSGKAKCCKRLEQGA
ncbi:MAG: DUF1033 family protein [Enterococcus viikkiensis]|uniref:DUF1033 family protein n=1 Tax=Enterococcus viikkiensis TaxID=930854 RepID=A0ABU3FPV2_9ENTE|nr:DUF1033 family protein [Enterococcus viikkiensis]MDT2828003.1 DUF1033 family protein [Enterococcus viikkiensis]